MQKIVFASSPTSSTDPQDPFTFQRYEINIRPGRSMVTKKMKPLATLEKSLAKAELMYAELAKESPAHDPEVTLTLYTNGTYRKDYRYRYADGKRAWREGAFGKELDLSQIKRNFK